MRKTNPEVRYLGIKDVPWTMNGTNLANLRRSELSRLATRLKAADVNSTKNELLHAIRRKLYALDVEPGELTDEGRWA